MALVNDLATKPHVYSWSTKIDFEVNSVGGFQDFEGTPACLNWDQNLILVLERRTIHPHFEASGTTGYRLILDAAQTACEAEELGRRLACALLKFAIGKTWGLRLAWQDTPLPCRVIDRTASRGFESEGFVSGHERIALSDFTNELDEAFSALRQAPCNLLLSMELCASARFESDNRARLILLVSALEALAERLDLTGRIGGLVSELEELVIGRLSNDERLKNSVLGQVRQLQRESSRQSIRRLLTAAELSDADIGFVDDAYSARSKIVHEGLRIPELNIMAGRFEEILRRLYEYKIGTL